MGHLRIKAVSVVLTLLNVFGTLLAKIQSKLIYMGLHGDLSN